ncbi:hypothetical protein IV203_017865 [Nitzschia inconspicua]|uniref:Uncharacterized protein n=1 Tax=Nitzschia inconspicua TaxID=303405 RepID=A0A9K3M010_9STRA|nr:hypothetical protein IV203_017865 [Nitzschia inconspicua]
MPKKSDIAVRFLEKELKNKRLDPRTDSDTVIETYIDDTGVTQEIRDQLSEYVATKKSKQNWQSYWYKLRKAYLNEFENLDPARNAPGPSPVAYPRPTLRFEGDTKGSEEDDQEHCFLVLFIIAPKELQGPQQMLWSCTIRQRT